MKSAVRAYRTNITYFCYDCWQHSITTETRWSQSAGSWLIHPLSVCTQITEMRKFSMMITYIMSDFCQIQRESRTEYCRFTLGYMLMSKFISMGIKRQPQDKTYRRLRAWWNFFYWIHIISRTRQEAQGQEWGTTTINHMDLSLITKSITPGQFLTLSQVNIRSTRNKIGQFQQHLTKSSTDICVLLETWLKDSDEEKTLISQILPPSFNISYPRKNGRGGGMVIFHSELVKILVHEGNYKAMTMECSSYKIKLADETLSLYATYHIPSTGVLQFCGKLTRLLEQDMSYK